MMVVIIDYGMGNLRSIQHKLQKIGIATTITSEPEIIQQANAIILPGVGHFATAMDNLRRLELLAVLHQKVIQDRTPVMGICLGMQLMTTFSEEGGHVPGLGWLDAETKRFAFPNDTPTLRVPHVGWNTVMRHKEVPAIARLAREQRFYFTHSYYVCCHDSSDVLGTTIYGHEFVSMVSHDNILGTQFHPEKSHRRGLHVMEDFIRTSLC